MTLTLAPPRAAPLDDERQVSAWRNRWFLHDGRALWGGGIFATRADAELAAAEIMKEWDDYIAEYGDAMCEPPYAWIALSEFSFAVAMPWGGPDVPPAG